MWSSVDMVTDERSCRMFLASSRLRSKPRNQAHFWWVSNLAGRNGHVWFDERSVETEHGTASEALLEETERRIGHN